MTQFAISCGALQLLFVPNGTERAMGAGLSGSFQMHYEGALAGAVSLVETAPLEGVIGYGVNSEFCGRGLASAAVGAVIAAAPGLGFHMLSAQCRSNNAASRRVLEKTGFILNSTAPFWSNGRDSSLLFMVYRWMAASRERDLHP